MSATNEGLVLVPSFAKSNMRWTIPEGPVAIAKWLEESGIKTDRSPSGVATEQIIKTCGGLAGVTAFAHPGVVQLMNEMTRKSPIPAMNHMELRDRLKKATGSSGWKTQYFDPLVENQALRLGMKVRCSDCSQWTWYQLDQLGYHLTCQFCLRQNSFPVTNPALPDRAVWAYRPAGPFALPRYADGGYAASLAVRFFQHTISDIFGPTITWTSGQTLDLGLTSEVEADFIVWYQRKEVLGPDHTTQVVFGEAKSFGREAFEAQDIERMTAVAKRFPGSVIVFATMREAMDLSREEVNRLRKFATWGRHYLKDRLQTRAPVIVLTGTELFARIDLKTTWTQQGGNRAAFVGQGFLQTDSLRELANLTQQAYLGMQAYGDWLTSEWHRRASTGRARA